LLRNVELLERLAALRKSGALSEDEFQNQKSSVLANLESVQNIDATEDSPMPSMEPNRDGTERPVRDVVMKLDRVQNPARFWTALAVLAVGLLAVLFMFGGGTTVLRSSVGDKAASEYSLVVKASDGPAEPCKAAGTVAAGYLEDENQAKYVEWKALESDQCERYEKGKQAAENLQNAFEEADAAVSDFMRGR